MKKIELLFLSKQDVVDVGFTMKETISIVEDVLSDHGRGDFENPPKPGIHPVKDSFIHAMPGFLPKKMAGGMKWVSGFTENYKVGLPTIMGLIVLNDVQTGQPIAMMDGTYITNMRTAAVSGVAIKYLAQKDSRIVGLVGAGIQGRYHLQCLKEVLPKLEVVKIFDLYEEAVHNLIADQDDEKPFDLLVGKSIEDVLSGADVAITATGWLEDRIFKADWIDPGTLILPVHARGWEAGIVGKCDKFFVDDWGQFSHVLGGEGYYDPLPAPSAELGEVVIGKKPGRDNEQQRIVNFNFGMAIHDISMASKALERARQKSLGTELRLM